MLKTAVVCVLVLGTTVAKTQRGVSPEDLHLYKAEAPEFTCKNGQKNIPVAMVNDEYCDCEDGSDEPGTSACANGQFYCANVGHQPLILPSSRVQDMICDCCDGSDEVPTIDDGVPPRCVNTCKEDGYAAMREILEQIKVVEDGVQIRTTLIQAAAATRAEKEAALVAAKAKYEELKATWEARKATKEEEEKVENEEKVKREAAAEAEAAESAESELAKEAAAELAGEAVPQPEAPPAIDASVPEQEAPPALDPTVTEPAAEEKPKENFPYPQEYAFNAEENKEENQENKEEKKEENFPYPAEYSYTEANKKEDVQPPPPPATEEATEPPAVVEEQESVPEQEKEPEQYVHPAAEEARRLFDEVDPEYNSAKSEMENLEKELGNDFGPEEQFFSLFKNCIDVNQQQYTYQVCPYGTSYQKEGGSSTSLGNWEGYIINDQNQFVFDFKNGQTCWQGPARSLSVVLECGTTNELYNIEEPSKCVYTAKLKTPAVCTPTQLAGLKSSLPPSHEEL